MSQDYRYYGFATTKPDLSCLDNVKLVAVDIETHSLADPIPVGIGLAYSPTDSFYWSLLPPSPDIPWHLLRDPSVTKVYHNAPYDLRFLREWGVDNTNVMDTAVMARMAIIPGDLEGACEAMETPTRPRHMKDVWAEAGVTNSIDMPADSLAIKCCQDCLGTYQLYLALMDKVDMEYVRSEMEILPILEEMSTRGIALDQLIRYALETIYTKEEQELSSLCMEEFGMNPGSPQQVGYILSKRGNFLPRRRARGTRRWSMSTDEATLEKILGSDPLAGLVLRYRHVRKMLGTYLVPYRDQARAYTYFHLDAATARVSSSSYDHELERNLQNVPGDPTGGVSIRNMFIPDNRMFTDMDFSQVELRVLAHLSDDQRMQDILNDPNGDIHQETANFLNVPRKVAKNCTFAITYGATAQTVMETAHIRDIRLAQRMLDMIFRRYPGLGDWIRSTQEFGRHHGYVTTLGGRNISVIREGEEENEAAIDRKSSNYPIQGTAAEIMKRALKIARVRTPLPMAHQVHDEVIWDGWVGEKDTIEGWFNGVVAPFPTPVGIKYTERWE